MAKEKPIKISERAATGGGRQKAEEPAAPEQERRTIARHRPKQCVLSYVKKAFFSFMSKPGVDRECAVTDLSRAGVQFLCNEELKRGQGLVVTLTIRHGPAMRLVGEVIWISEVSREGRFSYRVGVHFTEYLDDSWKRLRDWENHMQRGEGEER